MKIKWSIFFFLIIVLLITGFKKGANNGAAVISFDKYKVAEGFEIQLAASEPFIQAPVALDFDDRGRMWVVEMRGFMPNLAGVGDHAPIGRISILEDLDKDGVAEHAKVFVDSLVLPRAAAHVYGGILYNAPPNLWFVEIKNDKPGKKVLVDSLYSVGGSPEAQPNGLMMNIDNWIYSASSQFRYQRKNGKWIKEPTSFRGQFGISKDNFGRLYYNYNENHIAGDYVLPNTLIANPYLKPKEAINKLLTENERVYPLQPTTVNRGYSKGILDKDSVLLHFTAACGTMIYRGDQFPDEYNLNAFACEPQANLVKRDVLAFEDVKTTAMPAWNDREFLASTDEGFRPVNLYTGPDGAMYVVDMHRGIMEYKAFATPYYNKGIADKKLDTLLHAGRILRVKSKAKQLGKVPDLAILSANELVANLKSPNGWIRDRSQQIIIRKQLKTAIPELQKLAVDSKNPVPAIHALHTLNGLNALTFHLLKKVAAYAEPMLSAHALLLTASYNTPGNAKAMSVLANNLFNKNNAVINLYLAMSLGSWSKTVPGTFLPLLAKIADSYPDKAIYQEAVISSLNGLEERFRKIFNSSTVSKKPNQLLASLLDETIKNKREGKKNSIFVQVKTPIDARTNGLELFRTTCAPCHGVDGDGVEHVGPPLKGSEYVEGSADRLAMIVLNGLEGPVHINDQLYKFNGTMPNFANNFTDNQIANIIRYLHNAYATKSVKPINAEKIKELRMKKIG
ncbi:MAG: c-type cytochrome, partial [Bacteroidota bacterium]|nr:c-type cytochrome [Bacteroidota bacterium]